METFDNIIYIINEKYLVLLNELLEKFKYHDELLGTLKIDIKNIVDKNDDKYYIINILTDNFLFCLEQISDHNADYFIYQKEKIPKKNGKIYKNKLPRIGIKTYLKRILTDCNSNYADKLFKEFVNYFLLLTTKNEDNTITFCNDYIDYVKNNFKENRNFSKMLMVFDNIDNILNVQVKDEEVVDELFEESVDPSKIILNNKKKNKKNKKFNPTDSFNPEFMKGLENTKIAQLAKNISEKINIDDFPSLSDPSKLLSSLSNPSEEGGIQNLLKFVVGEVEDAFKNNNLNEKELVGEAQDIMGKFQNNTGFDPMSILKNGNFNMDQFADIFANMKK